MRSLSRKKANRTSLLRNLATSLVLYEKITTTTAKAKELKPIIEHLIAKSKGADLTARRNLISYFFDENAVKKMLEVIVPRYKDLNSGFVKSYKVGRRLGDGADMTILELVNVQEPVKKEVKDDKQK